MNYFKIKYLCCFSMITERNFLVQWRRQDLARGGAQNDIEITSVAHSHAQ